MKRSYALRTFRLCDGDWAVFAQYVLKMERNGITHRKGHRKVSFLRWWRSGLCPSTTADSRKAAAEGVGEQVKTPQCGVFTQRYPTKQGVCRAEQAQATADDYATGEGPSNPTEAAGVSPAAEGREKTGRRGRRALQLLQGKWILIFRIFDFLCRNTVLFFGIPTVISHSNL